MGVKFPQIYKISETNQRSRDHMGGYTELKEYLQSLSFNFNKLKEIASRLTINLNNIIDYNYYPIPEHADLI